VARALLAAESMGDDEVAAELFDLLGKAVQVDHRLTLGGPRLVSALDAKT
jgi:hypothetical protein